MTKRFLLLAASVSAFAATPVIDPERFIGHVKYLASDELKGRLTGTPEQEKAARYIAGQFDKLGLQTVGPKRTYLQSFKVNVSSKSGPKNKLVTRLDGKTNTLRHGSDYTAFSFSSSAKVTGALVFAGYGITAKQQGYDDYAGLDAKDKIVVVFRHEPQENDEKSVFAGKSYSMHASLESKATNAKNHGAKALIVINNPHHPEDAEKLEAFNRPGPADSGLPFVQVKSPLADAWFTAAGKSAKEIADAIDEDLKPRSFAFPATLQAELQTDVERVQKNTQNVIGYLPGQTDEYVVVGAHYDHLGLGEQFSLAPSLAGTIHPGADDNASGTSGVIELARWFMSQPKPKRGIVFMAFTGEELGLLGSGYYVENPLLPLAKCAAMVNMDMIGRMRENRLIAGGVASGSTFKALMEQLEKRYAELKIDYSEPAGFGGSDHTSFASKQVPTLFFFSGLHGDYHRPSDTWDKVDPQASARLLALVGDATQELANGERAEFIRAAAPASAGHGGGGGNASASGYGPYFGSIPDMAFNGKGVKFTDLREGSPAMKAGLKPGDIMIEFDGKKTDNLYDYTYALRQKAVGDKVIVKVLRNGQAIDAEVLLEARK